MYQSEAAATSSSCHRAKWCVLRLGALATLCPAGCSPAPSQQFLLWLIVVIAMPVALVVAANLLTGRQPILLLPIALAARLAACARFCAGEANAERVLVALAREGTLGLANLLKLAGAAPSPRRPDYTSLVRGSEQLALALLDWRLVATTEERQRAVLPSAAWLRAVERCVRGGVVAEVLPLGAAECYECGCHAAGVRGHARKGRDRPRVIA